MSYTDPIFLAIENSFQYQADSVSSSNEDSVDPPLPKIARRTAFGLLCAWGIGSAAAVSAADLGDAANDDDKLAALRQRVAEIESRIDSEDHDVDERGFELEFHGYGELHFLYHDFAADQTREGGAPAERRAVFDAARLALELEGELIGGFEFEAEIEFEHGGTGAALELEYEEFGEYETEIESGGEVIVEELYLAKAFGDFELKLGRFYVALGLLPEYHRPTDYLGALRPESMTTVLPGLWDEMGLALEWNTDSVEATLQAVSGLDSTGFSSQFWVASGHQSRFELVRATNLALVARADVVRAEGIRAGMSAYWGNTTGNRPKQDLEGVNAPVLILDVHAAIDRGPVSARAMAVWGQLSEVDTLNERNRRLSNNLDVLRSAVAEQALAAWAEVGVDIAHFFPAVQDHEVAPYLRFEMYDTMLRTSADSFDNPRFERNIYTGGLSWTYLDAVVTKLDVVHRRFGTTELRPETSGRLAAGFVF